MKQAVSPASIQPDDRVLFWLKSLQLISSIAVFVVGITILACWVIPPFGKEMPHSFFLMRANTSLLVVLSAASVAFSMPRTARFALRVSQVLAGVVVVFAFLILLKDFGFITLHIETLLAPDSASIFPGKVSPEAALCFMLLGTVLMGLRARKTVFSYAVDGVTLLLLLAMLIFLARYFFGLSHLFKLFQNNPFSIQTLVSLLLLTGMAATRRAEYGMFAILLDQGSGGMTARLAIPFAILLPFAVAVPKALLVRINPAQESSSTAVATSLLSISAVCLVLLLAWRTKAFEATVRDLSIRDELTGLYNRRGFYVLANQAFLIAQRARESFTVIFFDMDNLKHVNDTLGHEAGSGLLKEMAELLIQTFRKTDVIGRIGGDEYVVAGKSYDPEMNVAMSRLHQGLAAANNIPDRKYSLSFSMGVVASDGDPTGTFENLVARADAVMYQEKLRKRRPDSQ